ncbi:hypothetical protein C8254_10490 [Sulfitobacter sp. CB-A]|nr:hypothetical protein C8254_10490 [Sulfitobacter sp. CB-A]
MQNKQARSSLGLDFPSMAQKNTQTRWLGSDGYYQIKLTCGTIVAEHRILWEEAHGPIPDGFQIHHKSHNRTDNRIENLDCVDTVTHKRLHVGHRLIDGVWVKTCTQCGVEQPENDFPTKRYVEGVRMTRGNCRECERERQRAKNGHTGDRFTDGSPIFGRHFGPRSS